MKLLLITCSCMLACLVASATNYYIDTTGSDANTGTSIASPWKTISKVNRSFPLFSPGDKILFKCGQRFFGTLVVSRSGNAVNPIILGSYGTGKKPVISGFNQVAGFTKTAANLWQSDPIPAAHKPNMVTIDAVATPVGRYPNKNYLTVNSSVGDNSITDTRLAGSANWTGAELVIRKAHWILSRDVINAHRDSTLTYKGLSGYNTRNGYGYFIQGSLLTLDLQNEWFFDNDTRRLTIFSKTMPKNVKLSVKDTLLLIGQQDYVIVDGLGFEGANIAAIAIGSLNNQAKNIQVKNCDINFSGRDAIYAINNVDCSVTGCTVSNSWNNGILFAYVGGKSLRTTIANNVVKNIGSVPGMGFMSVRSSYNTSYTGISVSGDKASIQYNLLDTIGYNGINYYFDSSEVKYNRVNYYCFVKDDGAGIYTWTGYTGTPRFKGRKVVGNLLLNGIGAGTGTADGANAVQGIYLDDGTTGVLVDSNGVYNMAYGGIYVHNTQQVRITNNVVYNCKVTQLLIVHDNTSPHSPIRDLVLQNNQFIARDLVPVVIIETTRNDVDSFALKPGDIDNNFYYRPVHDEFTIRVKKRVDGRSVVKDHTLSSWKSDHSHYDLKSGKPEINFGKTVTMANVDEYVRFEGTVVKQRTLPLGRYRYENLRREEFSGNITLAPYRPVVLFRTMPPRRASDKKP